MKSIMNLNIPKWSMGPNLIRGEFFGSLIWSDSLRSYFRPVTDDAENLCKKILSKNKGDNLSLKEYNFSNISKDLIADANILLGDCPIETVSRSKENRLSAPLELYFDFTWLCNLAKKKCGQDSFCYAAEFLGPTTMPETQVRSILSEIRKLGIMRVHLAGGEPTLHLRHFENYLSTTHQLGLWTSVNTNGTLVNDKVMDIVLANGLKSMSFSIDGPTKDEFESVRGSGTWEPAIKGLKTAVRRVNEDNSDLQISIKPTFPPHIDEKFFINTLELAESLGVKSVKFANPERCTRQEKGHYSTTVEDHYKNIDIIEKLKKDYGGSIQITGVNNPLAGCADIGIPGLSGCIGGQELMAINPNGDITPCLIHSRTLGNINETITVKNFLDSFVLDDFNNEISTSESCQSCSIHSQCRGGSVTRRVVELGIPTSKDSNGMLNMFKDPLCPSDYLQKNPDAELPPKRENLTPNRHFVEVVVKHSL